MPGPGIDLTVEERLERARLLPRVNQEVLTMCKTVDQLLHAQHISNLAQAIVCVQELAREHYAVVLALKWVVLLVDMLESDAPDVRLASCNAIAAVSMVQEGRDAVRSSGGLRPLVMLLAEGSRSSVAAAAAAALMNCSACDTCKEAIADCRGVPMLLGLIREAVARCNPVGGGAYGSGDAARSGGSATQDLHTPGGCKAAVYAAGALMNMGGVITVQELLMAAGAVQVLEAVIRIAGPGDVVATRANFMLSWLAVASSAAAGTLDRRSEKLDSVISPSATPRSLPSVVSTRPSGQQSLRQGASINSQQQPLPQPQASVTTPSLGQSQLSSQHRMTSQSIAKPGSSGAPGAGKPAVVAGHA
ncbi:hypothetical protein Vafri_8286 [Volvox africanus]|nr:hypothetical protein Vafri_8286 [Volvox africanus]